MALVTGAAGFIGCHLVERLTRAGWRIRGVDDERTGDWARVKVPLERIDKALETLSADELRDACSGVDHLFHLAAEKHNTPGVTADRTLDVNVTATARLFDAAGAAGVARIVFASSLYAYGATGPAPMREDDLPTPWTVYGTSKLCGEHLLRTTGRRYGTEWSVARLFFIYGPRQLAEGGYPSVIVRNFDRISRGDPPVVSGDGDQALDYVFVDDCVDGLLALARAPRSALTVNLAGGRAITVNELTRRMLEVSGSSLLPVNGPPDWTAGTARWGATSVAADAIGWAASTSLDDGLRRVWEGLR